MWPDNRILDLFGIDIPIIQAPTTGSVLSGRVVAVSEAGGLGSLACALLSIEQARRELEVIRRRHRARSMSTSSVTSSLATTRLAK